MKKNPELHVQVFACYSYRTERTLQEVDAGLQQSYS